MILCTVGCTWCIVPPAVIAEISCLSCPTQNPNSPTIATAKKASIFPLPVTNPSCESGVVVSSVVSSAILRAIFGPAGNVRENFAQMDVPYVPRATAAHEGIEHRALWRRKKVRLCGTAFGTAQVAPAGYSSWIFSGLRGPGLLEEALSIAAREFAKVGSPIAHDIKLCLTQPGIVQH